MQTTTQYTTADGIEISPLPARMRALLLEVLDIGYGRNCAQTRLANAPDAAIAWQVQSMLDDYADYEAKQAWNLIDDAEAPAMGGA